MTNCADPCDDCKPKSEKKVGCSCQPHCNCSICNEKKSHPQNCNCDKCQKNLKCKIICDKKPHNSDCSCSECQKLYCKISCSEGNSESKLYEIKGQINLNPVC